MVFVHGTTFGRVHAYALLIGLATKASLENKVYLL